MKLTKYLNKAAIISLIVILLIGSGLIYTTQPVNSNNIDHQVPIEDAETILITRGAPRGPLEVNGSKVHWINDTQTYTSIWVRDSATLNVKGGNVTVTTGRFNVTDDAEIIIQSGSMVECKWGTFRADCKSFQIDDSSLRCGNGSDENTREGFDATITIKTRDDISITNSDIRVEAGHGRPATEPVNKGGDGGDGYIEIESAGQITITGKKTYGIKSDGGSGGQGYTSAGGRGGNGNTILTSGAKIIVDNGLITSAGGKGGDKDTLFGKKSGNGGDADLKLYAFDGKKYIEIKETDLLSQEGKKGTGDDTALNGMSSVDFKCSWLQVDTHKKSATTPTQPASKIRAKDGIAIQTSLTPYNADLYVVDTIGENNERVIPSRPLGDSKTEIFLYWWVTVKVIDESGQFIEGAEIDISDDKNANYLKDDWGTTDATGEVHVLLHSREYSPLQTEIEYEFTASESGASNSVKAELNDNNRIVGSVDGPVEVVLKLVTVEVTSVMDVPANELATKKVGGLATVKGTALPASGERQITNVKIMFENQTTTPVNVVDTSIDITSPYSTWSYDWDASSIANDKQITIIVEATDSVFNARTELPVIVNQKVVNHAPFLSVIFPKNNTEVESSTTNKTVRIHGYAKDNDYDTDEELLPAGRNVSMVYITIKDSIGNVVVSYSYDFSTNWNNPKYRWDWEYDWDVWVTEGADYKFPDGNYTLTINAHDTANKYSNTEVLNFYLQHHIPPVAVLGKLEFNDDGSRVVVEPELTQADTVATYTIFAPKGDRKITINFDGSASYDLDGPGGKPVEYKWNYDGSSPTIWDRNLSTSNWEYILVPKDTENEKTITFMVEFKVRDSDGNENKIIQVKEGGNLVEVTKIELVIHYRPPAEKPKGWFANIVDLGLDFSEEYVQIIFVILIVMINAVGGLVIMKNNRNIVKKRKAREDAMDARIERDQAAEAQQAADFLESTPETASAPPEQAAQYDQYAQTATEPYQEPAATTPAAPTEELAAAPASDALAAPSAPADALPTAQPPAQEQLPTPPAAPPRLPPAAAATTTAAPAAAPAPAAAQPATAAPPPQTVACPTCGAQIAVNITPCPSCNTNLNWN
ncbi:MAG: hypothetical protein KAJ51_01375 [Thermoplasmata archaeon]|nr:hypothetical protein [Thermoplasmata archaeon]